MKTIQEMMDYINPPDAQGGAYCNAIDEDLYDSSQWENRMPADGYSFYTDEETGECSVSYTNYFACWDGWDCMSEECGVYASEKEAVTAIYNELVENNRQASINAGIINYTDYAMERVIESIKSKKNLYAMYLIFEVFATEKRLRGLR